MNPLLQDVPNLSTEQELFLLKKYSEDGDMDAAGRVLHARGPWIYSLIHKLKLRKSIDRDTAFTDAIGEALTGIKIYDPTRSSFSTFLYRIILFAARRSAKRQLECDQVLDFFPDKVIDDNHDYSESVENVQRVLDEVPADEMNEESRKVASLMMKALSDSEIAARMDWTVPQAEAKTKEMRNYISWLLVRAGLSCEPIIMDREILRMADEYERINKRIWFS